MTTTFGRKSLRAIENHESGAAFIVAFFSRNRNPKESHGICQTTILSLELVHDRTGDVAAVPATSEAGAVQGSPQVVLRGNNTRNSGCNGGAPRTLYRHRGRHERSSDGLRPLEKCQSGLTVIVRGEKVRAMEILELIAYGLAGLAAMLVIAFCFAYGDELSSAREKSSFDPVNRNAASSDSRMISTPTGNPRFQETVPACLLPTTSTSETGTGTIYGDS